MSCDKGKTPRTCQQLKIGILKILTVESRK